MVILFVSQLVQFAGDGDTVGVGLIDAWMPAVLNRVKPIFWGGIGLAQESRAL